MMLPGRGFGYGRNIATSGYGVSVSMLVVAVRFVLRLVSRIAWVIHLDSRI